MHAAKVQFYARLSKPGEPTLRMALCHFFKWAAPLITPQLGTLLRSPRGEYAQHELNYPVLLMSIDTKLMRYQERPGSDMFFAQYTFQSKIN